MKKPKIMILDTSVICHDPDCLHSFEENDIVIAPAVLRELNKLKRGDGTASRNAREAVRIISAMPSKEIFNGGSSLGDGLGKLRILKKDYPFNIAVKEAFGSATNDALIVNVAYCMVNSKKSKTANEPQKIIFVSKDFILRLQAESLDLDVEDYKNDLILDYDSLCKPADKIEVPLEIIEEIYAKKESSFNPKENSFENEFIILSSSKETGGKTALVCYAKGKIHLILRDKMAPFGIKSRNAEQAFSLSALLNKDLSLIALTGKAGTGKTILALAAALQYLDDGNANEIYFTRVPVPVGHDIGFLPGTADDKLSPYMQSMFDNLSIIESFGSARNKESLRDFKTNRKYVIEPVNSIRGRSLVKKFFIIDEAQNLTPHEVKTLITRAGDHTKIILMGDPSQIDSPYLDKYSNGLIYAISRMRGQSVFAHVFLVKGERSYLAELAADLL